VEFIRGPLRPDVALVPSTCKCGPEGIRYCTYGQSIEKRVIIQFASVADVCVNKKYYELRMLEYCSGPNQNDNIKIITFIFL
jgi:hypothetical protein